MENYYITYTVNVYEDSYNDGELSNVDYYNGKGLIKANTPKEAIVYFFKNELCFDIELNNLDNEIDNVINCFSYSVLCDDDNIQVRELDNDFQEWKKGNINLYANNIEFKLYKLQQLETLN